MDSVDTQGVVSNNFLEFLSKVETPRDKPFRAGAINLHISVPCPLKVRLKSLLENFVANYNATHEIPIYSPTLGEGEPHAVEDDMAVAELANELPDVWLTNNYHTLFSEPFKSRFIDSGLYVGVTKAEWFEILPTEFQDVAKKHNLGFYGFGSWGMVMDQSVHSQSPIPRRWDDLIKDDYRGEIGMHGCSGHVSGTALLMILNARLGSSAPSQFGKNVLYLKHFSQIIKSMDSSEPNKARFVLMPSAAITQIPSRKRVAQVELEDGPILTPMLLFVKKEKVELCAEVLDFFWGEALRDVLQKGDIYTVDAMDWSQSYSMTDMDYLASNNFGELSNALDASFQSGLSDEIKVTRS